METIQATVSPRLLTKASRLFTGTLQGRIIEILQNARRAGATHVIITNSDGIVTVRDNGKGIDDFAKLLDLGGSGWEQALEQSEDPAGVGLFSLAPRELTIRSNGKKATIQGDGWIGEPVEITDDAEPMDGTILCFPDEPWEHNVVESNAVFTGLNVTVDGKPCEKASFVESLAAHYPELGCRIEVQESSDLSPWYSYWRRTSHFCDNTFVNFHGQVVSFDFRAIDEHYLNFLIDMTGEPTEIRLMLPARTCLVENDAFVQLKAALEIEAYRYLQRRGHHRLPYRQYQRAQQLGVMLPEATPVFSVGLISGDPVEPIEVTKPERFPLSGCYRLNQYYDNGDETDYANVHLLAALGNFKEPFVPVDIRGDYDGYSWAKLPTIDKVEFQAGKVLHESWLWSGKIACVDKITITAHTSDGRTFRSDVCMGISPVDIPEKNHCRDEMVYLTAEAQARLSPSHIWFHFGGWNDDGDTYDIQEASFTEDLDHFWTLLIGPDEQFRRDIFGTLDGVKQNWKSVKVLPNGSVTIKFKDGSKQQIKPPKPSK